MGHEVGRSKGVVGGCTYGVGDNNPTEETLTGGNSGVDRSRRSSRVEDGEGLRKRDRRLIERGREGYRGPI